MFRHVLGGAVLLAIQKNRYWKRGGALCLDAGPFVAAIEYATGVDAVVAGKPSEQFFVAAAQSLGLAVADLVVVGDDMRTDVEGARAAGARGVLVRTGKFRAADLDDPDLQPDLVLDSIADLPSDARALEVPGEAHLDCESPSKKAGQARDNARPRGRGVGRWGPTSGREGFGAQPRLRQPASRQAEAGRPRDNARPAVAAWGSGAPLATARGSGRSPV